MMARFEIYVQREDFETDRVFYRPGRLPPLVRWCDCHCKAQVGTAPLRPPHVQWSPLFPNRGTTSNSWPRMLHRVCRESSSPPLHRVRLDVFPPGPNAQCHKPTRWQEKKAGRKAAYDMAIYKTHVEHDRVIDGTILYGLVSDAHLNAAIPTTRREFVRRRGS